MMAVILMLDTFGRKVNIAVGMVAVNVILVVVNNAAVMLVDDRGTSFKNDKKNVENLERSR